MRVISRNCYRKIAVGFVFSLFLFFILSQTQWSDKSEQLGWGTTDKNWEWSPEKLNEFMHLLDKHKEPIDTSAVQLTTNHTSTIDDRLQFPSLSQYLPHISDEESALLPSYVLSKRPINKKASIVFGVPHIRRSKESYLQLTLYFLIKNIQPKDLNDSLIVVLIAETDPEYVKNITHMIAHHFKDYISSGVLTVISPAKSYYPDFSEYKRQTLGDPLKRVHWRAKQNLDFAYLMMYSYSRAQYYVQLEDDVISSPDYVGQIKQCIHDLSNNKTDWFTVRFCRLGFIGQLLKTRDLPQLISFLLIFHEDQPSDWLLDYLIQVRTCRKDKPVKDCRQRKDSIWRTHHTSLFQHIGYHSSLDGKVQKLKDKFFKTKDISFFPHKDNPESAEVTTSLKAYKGHTMERAYKGEDLFWAMEPKSGDNITISFKENVLLNEISINSGNFDHPNDKMPDQTIVEIMPVKVIDSTNTTVSSDGFHVIGAFEDGFVKIDNLETFGLICKLRITVTKDSSFWLILNEIHIKSK